jgi:glycogen synthase
MRILFVSQEVPPETGWGGIGTYVDVLSGALVERGHDVHVLSVVDGQPASVVRRGGVTIHRFAVPAARDPTRRLPQSWRRLLLAVSVRRLVAKLEPRPDVVEAPEWMAEGLLLGFDDTLPLVVRLHSSARQLFPIGGVHGLDGKLSAWLEETSARRAHAVVSTASNLEEVAGPFGLNPQALHAIPYPVPLPPPEPLDTSAPPRITFVGRLEPRKAPEVVLRAAPGVLAEVPETRFVFVGRDTWDPNAPSASGWLRREAERLGVAQSVEFTGQLDRAGVMRELGRATVGVFPSRWESFGIVVAEAAALGRPVVVTPIAGFRDLVQDGVTGYMIDSDDAPGWAQALVRLLRDRSLARRMGEAGAERVRAISEPSRVAELAERSYEHARARWRLGLRASGSSRSQPS